MELILFHNYKGVVISRHPRKECDNRYIYTYTIEGELSISNTLRAAKKHINDLLWRKENNV